MMKTACDCCGREQLRISISFNLMVKNPKHQGGLVHLGANFKLGILMQYAG